jgi:SAM-dependent methyltransferase
MYKSIHSYGLNTLKIEIKLLIKQILKINTQPARDSDYINEIYEKIRKEKFENLDSFSTPKDYFFDIPTTFADGVIRYSLINNKLVEGKTSQVDFMILEIIEGIMRDTSCENVIELGSGCGKNLLLFASKYKDVKFIGLELNKTSVDLANTAAKKFNINNVEFYQCDLTNTEEYKNFLTKKTFIYSHHTLEEMPRIYKIPLNEIKKSDVQVVALLEPIFMFSFSRIILDLAKRLRIFNRDRLIGLKKFSKRKLSKYFNIELVDLGLGGKPENPTTLLLLKRK